MFLRTNQAGASPITYEGNEGKEQQVAQAIWDKLPPQARMQFGSFSQFFNSGAWKKVLAALQQQMQGGQEEIQETETETIGRAPQEGLGALMPQPRPMAFGGVAGADGRRAYGLGSIFKSITKPIKKVLKSDIGKAGLLGAGIFGLGGGFTGASGGFGFNPSNFSFGKILPKLLYKDPSAAFSLANISPWKVGGALSMAPFAMQAAGKWAPDETFDNLKLKAQEFGFDYSQMIRDIQNAENEEDYLAVLAKYNLSASDLPPWGSQKHAEGGRIGYAEAGDVLPEAPMSKEEMAERGATKVYDEHGLMTISELRKFRERQRQKRLLELLKNRRGAQEGGLMDLGGMEKDYRQEGGFVPIGGKEKSRRRSGKTQ